LRAQPRLRFAGQITGVEGYVESAAMGIMAGRMAAAERLQKPFAPPPPTTAHGALINHITGGHIATTDGKANSFQPMNVNFGLFPEPLQGSTRGMKHTEKATARKMAYTSRALNDFATWLSA
jgi:methylenetetrahydrofolate--tRNA-(uracil-5-)-methyltransferase